jgi:hypothetical protein
MSVYELLHESAEHLINTYPNDAPKFLLYPGICLSDEDFKELLVTTELLTGMALGDPNEIFWIKLYICSQPVYICKDSHRQEEDSKKIVH